MGRQDVAKTQDVVVLEMAQQLDLSQSSFRVFQVLERVGNLLDGYWLIGLQVNGRASDKSRFVRFLDSLSSVTQNPVKKASKRSKSQ